MRSGPVVIGYDGSPAAERALTEAAALLAPREALVVTVWEPGAAWPLMAPDISLAPIDISATLEVEQEQAELARQMAEQGAARARKEGLDAEGLAVADTLTVPETLVRLATEHDAAAVAVGSHGHGRLRELIVGSTARGVIKEAPCPTLVVRGPKDD